MGKKRLIIVIVAVLLTVAFVLVFPILKKEFEKRQVQEALKSANGCHVVDDLLYAHFSGSCYVFQEKNDELIMVTAVSVDGSENEDGVFVGELSLLDYQFSESGFLEGEPMVSKMGSFYTILDSKTCRHNETDKDGNNHMVTHFTDYEFTYYMQADRKDFLAVVIYEHVLDDYYIAILAANESEARGYYHWFRDNEPTLFAD